MRKDYFWIDGKRCDEYGIRLQAPVSFDAPKPKIETLKIPGRNGDLHIFEGAYENVSGTASCFALERKHVDEALHATAKWCLVDPGYHRLEVTDEPETFRLARVSTGPQTAIRMRRLAPFSLEFDCKPCKYLKDGGRPILFTDVGIDKHYFYNPGMPAKPVINIKFSGDLTLVVNGTDVRLSSVKTVTISLDSDAEIAYIVNDNGTKEVDSGVMKSYIFPTLQSGENYVSASNQSAEYVEIIPRWWTL